MTRKFILWRTWKGLSLAAAAVAFLAFALPVSVFAGDGAIWPLLPALVIASLLVFLAQLVERPTSYRVIGAATAAASIAFATWLATIFLCGFACSLDTCRCSDGREIRKHRSVCANPTDCSDACEGHKPLRGVP